MGISTTRVLQLFLVGFTGVFLFMMAVYWPMLTANPGSKQSVSIFEEVRADNVSGFPIEDEGYKINYEKRSDTYYAFIEGKTVSQFVENKNEAVLALKNKLIEDTLCGYNVIFSSEVGVNIPADYKNLTGCN